MEMVVLPMSPERRALLILLSLAVAGQGIRFLATRPDTAPGDIQLLGSSGERSPAAHAEAAQAAHRPLATGEKIDADRATALELARLPRVGLALAERIVADRESNGPFGTLEGLDRVSGVGPGLLRVVGPYLSFSGGKTVGPYDGNPSPATTTVVPSYRPTAIVNLNTASVAEIERLPLIGPSRAIAIVAWRERHGSFKNVEDLVLVPGVSPRMADAIRHLVAF
jgi:competence ComEA-like helix-hairpin-helix protein